MNARTLILLITCFFLIFTSVSRAGNVRFERLSVQEGLSQSIVYCTLQDSRGFLWFGSEDGLNRYDGYKFKIFRRDAKHPDRNICHNDIRAIYEDRDGFLWIGTFHGGLTRYDPRSGQFKHYRKNSGEKNAINNNVVRAIYQDRSGNLWFGTDAGLNRLDIQTGRFSVFRHDPANPNSLKHPAGDVILSIQADIAGKFWVGTQNGGVDLFDPERNRFIHFRDRYRQLAGFKSKQNHNIHTLYRDRFGILWIGFEESGLGRFDPNKSEFKLYKKNTSQQRKTGQGGTLSHNSVRAIFEDPSGILWVGTDIGLNRLDRKNDRFLLYKNHPLKPESLSHNEIRSIYLDRSGILWVGTYGGGVNKLNTRQKKFLHYKNEVDNPNSLSSNIVWSFCEDRREILWIGTHQGGLNRFDRRTGQFTVYKHVPGDATSLSNNSVRQIYEDRSGQMWIGTNGGGLCEFDRATGKFRTFRHDPGNPGSLSHNQIRSIHEDRSEVLWIGTFGGGLNRFDRKREIFTHFMHDESDSGSLSHNIIRHVYEDLSETLWIATYGGGLNKFDRKTNRFTHYRADPDDPTKLSNDYIFVIYEDYSHQLWVGTWGGGLNRFDKKSETFHRYSVDDGLPSNSIYGILEDSQRNLWISTTNGLSRFNLDTKTFRNFQRSDGLQSNEFNGGAFYKSLSGEMFFGGIDGFNAFYPDTIKDNSYIPPIAITAFQKMNRAVILDRPITAVREISLSYKDYFFSFEFTALDFTRPAENRYAYQMVGLDEDWIETDSTKRFAVYTTLDPGTYLFRVKGTNNDGVWNDNGTAIKVIISPPFWQTWWFRSLIIISFALAFLIFYRKKIKDLFVRTRMETELQTAHAAQMSIMPHEDPEIDGFDIASTCLPANEVGGDFFDYLWTGSHYSHFGIAVGDVSGKAMKAAIPAVLANGILFSKSAETDSILDIMRGLNHSLYIKTDKRIFTALMLVSIEKFSRQMTYINAGLPEPLLKSGTSVIQLKSRAGKIPLGIKSEVHFSEEMVQLKEGDVLILFTDGISESWNDHQVFYGTEGLGRILGQLDCTSMSANAIKDAIMLDIQTFSKDVKPHDDMTLIVVKVI